MTKTNTQRIKRIYELAEGHFGSGVVRFVGLKYEPQYGFIAKVKFSENSEFLSIFEYSEDATDALRKLKNRIKNIIKRYNNV